MNGQTVMYYGVPNYGSTFVGIRRRHRLDTMSKQDHNHFKHIRSYHHHHNHQQQQVSGNVVLHKERLISITNDAISTRGHTSFECAVYVNMHTNCVTIINFALLCFNFCPFYTYLNVNHIYWACNKRVKCCVVVMCPGR